MNPHVRIVAASLLAVGLALTATGCSGGSSPEPEAPTQGIEDSEDLEFDSDDKVPVPFLDPATGEMYMLMISQAQADCLLEQDVQGVTDMQTAMSACGITADAIMK